MKEEERINMEKQRKEFWKRNEEETERKRKREKEMKRINEEKQFQEFCEFYDRGGKYRRIFEE